MNPRFHSEDDEKLRHRKSTLAKLPTRGLPRGILSECSQDGRRPTKATAEY